MVAHLRVDEQQVTVSKIYAVFFNLTDTLAIENIYKLGLGVGMSFPLQARTVFYGLNLQQLHTR